MIITGGAGFIGSNLVSRLLREGHSVAVLDNLETGSMENIQGLEIDFFEADLRNYEEISKIFKSQNFDYCVHLGAMGSVPRSIHETRLSFESNVVGAFNVLENAKTTDLPVIFSSSSSVYGSNPKLPKNEWDWQSPMSPYGAFKSSSESMFLAYANAFDLRLHVLRLFNVYGPQQNPFGSYSAALPRWILAGFKKETITVFGDGNQKRDFTYVDDVTDVISKVMYVKNVDAFPINVAAGNPSTLNEIIEILFEYFGPLKIKRENPRNGDIRESESDPGRLKSVIGEVSWTQMKEGLFKTCEWYKNRFGF